jgi:hypothetical protein
VAERSFISRFFYKALEVVGAAIATAVSGYLVAHLGGFLPSQTQAPTSSAVMVAPSERPVAKSNPASAPAKELAAAPQPSQPAAAPVDADRRAAQTPPEATGPAAQPARKNTNTKTATSSRKSSKPETATPEAKTSEAKTSEAKTSEAKTSEAKTSEAKTSEAKPREAEDKDSVEARVKAALANVDANRPPAADASSRRENQASQPRPLDSPPAASGSAVQPRSADLGAPAQQPMAQPATTQSSTAQTPPAPVQATPIQPMQPQQPDALTSVEIKSRPVATIDSLPAAPEAAPPQEEEKGVLSIFKRILPDLRRPASADEAPRPPAPVGQ